MKPECPSLRKKSGGDETYYFCDINDHPCLVEYHDDECEEYNDFLREEKMADLEVEKLAWYILDEITTKHSASHSGSGKRPCPICDRAEEAMRLLNKPTHEECKELYNRRNGV